MTEFDTFLSDAIFPERQIIQITFDDRFGTDEIDHLPDVIVMATSSGEHAVICPYVVPGSLTVEVAIFDAEGARVGHQLIGGLA